MESKVFIPSSYRIQVGGKSVSVARTVIAADLSMGSIKIKSYQQNGILVDKAIWTAINQYSEMGGFSGLTLKEYLIRLFKGPQSIIP